MKRSRLHYSPKPATSGMYSVMQNYVLLRGLLLPYANTSRCAISAPFCSRKRNSKLASMVRCEYKRHGSRCVLHSVNMSLSCASTLSSSASANGLQAAQAQLQCEIQLGPRGMAHMLRWKMTRAVQHKHTITRAPQHNRTCLTAQYTC